MNQMIFLKTYPLCHNFSLWLAEGQKKKLFQNSNTFAQVWENTPKKSLTLLDGFQFGS
jgi:hypothetical protein